MLYFRDEREPDLDDRQGWDSIQQQAFRAGPALPPVPGSFLAACGHA